MNLPVRWEMRVAPRLDSAFAPASIVPRHALLINPFYPKDRHASFAKHVLTPSLALTSIAAATPEAWQVRCWDENLLQGPPPVSPFPQVVGITVHLTFARRAYELARWFRERGAIVVLGGMHVMACPEEAAAHADCLAVGEGVQTWPAILRDIDAGNLQRLYRGDYARPWHHDPPPRRDLLPRGSFLTTMSLNATRGCHNRCGFCYLSTKGLRQPYMERDPHEIFEEIRQSRAPYAVFTDNNLGSDPKYLLRLCAALAPLRITWSAAVSLDATDHPGLVREMALSGCVSVFVGFETLSDANVIAAHKRSPAVEDYARRVEMLHAVGIQVNGSFVFGFDDDRPDVFARTIAWIEANRLECATFHILTPYPGTPLFRQMEAEGRLLHKNWDLYDTSHVVFRPRHLSPKQLFEGYAWCYRRLFSHRSIWRRRPRDRGAVPAYLAMSYLYKKCNSLWRILIKHQWVHAVWRPLIELSRRRHVKFREQLSHRPIYRPEALERPLASRSGRVDQATEFPLPDGNGRKKVIHMYSTSIPDAT